MKYYQAIACPNCTNTQPMAAIIIGGLVSSTFLNLLLMPVILARYGQFKGKS